MGRGAGDWSNAAMRQFNRIREIKLVGFYYSPTYLSVKSPSQTQAGLLSFHQATIIFNNFLMFDAKVSNLP